MSAALHLRPWTDQRMVLESEDRGRPARTAAGSHVADLVSLKKAVVLCFKCRPKFDAKKNEYITRSSIPFVGGRCDGCREVGMDRHLYLHQHSLPR